MASTRLRFTWRLTFDGDPLMAHEVLPDVDRVLTFWVNHSRYKGKFIDPQITGYQFGRLEVSLTVIAHDQWRCRQRSEWIARALQSAARVNRVEVINPSQDKLPPHQHRGGRRFEAPKYQETAHG